MVPLFCQWSTGFPAAPKSGKTRTFLFVLMLLCLILNLNAANAQGIAVVPNELDFDEDEKEIIIYNLNEAETEYLIYAKNNPEMFEIAPSEVLIQENGSEKIKIKLKSRKAFEDIIYIKEISNGKNIISGIGIRAFREKEFYDGKELAAGSLVLLGGVLVYFYRKT